MHRLDQHGCFQRAASTQFADRIDREALEIMASDRKKRLLQTKLVVLGLANARLVQFRSSIIIAVARGNADGAFVQASQKVTMIRSEEHTSELQSLMRNSYAVFCLQKK